MKIKFTKNVLNGSVRFHKDEEKEIEDKKANELIKNKVAVKVTTKKESE